jgi:putative DNA primase/helicase
MRRSSGSLWITRRRKRSDNFKMSTEDNNNINNNSNIEEEKKEERQQKKKSLEDIADILNGEKKDPEYARIAQEEAAAAEEEERQRREEEEDERRQLEEQRQRQQQHQQQGGEGDRDNNDREGEGEGDRRERESDEQNGGGGGRRRRDTRLVSIGVRAIMNSMTFATLEENNRIYYYKDGVYVPGGEIRIAIMAEQLFGLDLESRDVTEITKHIMRMTYHKLEEFDKDINIINLKNGLYKIEDPEGKHFMPHTPDYLSLSQKPIVYNPELKTLKKFIKFLTEVLYPEAVGPAVDIIAYTFYRRHMFEIVTKLFGYGSNGKSVFVGFISVLHGHNNISNVPYAAMDNDRFALFNMVGKYVNIDSEMPTTKVKDTSTLKKVTSNQPIRVQQKFEPAFDAVLYAKLFFNANLIPPTDDTTPAYYRRQNIIAFPYQFEGRKDNVNLLAELTTQDEISAVFNMMMHNLRQILKTKKIRLTAKTIDERQRMYELASAPVRAFINEAVEPDSIADSITYKEDLYKAYQNFCKENRLAILSAESLGKELKSKFDYKDGRERKGDKKGKRYWLGITLRPEYQDIDEKQQTL